MVRLFKHLERFLFTYKTSNKVKNVSINVVSAKMLLKVHQTYFDLTLIVIVHVHDGVFCSEFHLIVYALFGIISLAPETAYDWP